MAGLLNNDYDYRAARAAGIRPGPNGHWPDTYKLPNHMTFSNESMYSTPQHPGGEWQNSGSGWSFWPSPYNLQQHTPQQMEQYFGQVEPDSILAMPLPPLRRR